ncbi:DUF4424 family protein [Stagnihabitans tardus]|uniref:DUF4424 domain-containing protein n=1 Tax=Stagnihabitans tardus TaxID=2699202 RepID=A0AAE5BRG1_9RHOB|nr:DUF4424 family protein [Stagnihabitans tardus]NBZ86510.1 DUF4424 domain-containing protein [Stagnihabitans tardus]
MALLLAGPALANDGFGGFTATGLTFGQTDKVAMETEDLMISPDRISVDYTFRNLTDQDVTGEVIFPLPPIPMGDLINGMWNLPEDTLRENLMDFKAVVDGAPVALQIDRLAVILPEAWWELTPSQQYDTPGQDVTALLAEHGLAVSLDGERAWEEIQALSPASRDALLAAGVIGDYDDTEGFDLYPNWSVVLRYHWTQTFKAGAVTKVHHDYENRPTGGVFGWEHPPEQDYLKDIARTYCIDEGTSTAIAKALARPDASEGAWGMAYQIDYVLRTANSWAGPIQRFTLTLDKGDPANVISLCAEGVKKTGPTTFTVEKTDFTPDQDLKILLVQPAGE